MKELSYTYKNWYTIIEMGYAHDHDFRTSYKANAMRTRNVKHIRVGHFSQSQF